ncbi:copper oxidase [Methylocystis heyeri]|uniref:Copper oxidase n=1 Tax=Methylocystis heyeri TaxID=391905 RepID=A0A6B8KKN8_9HYPH|nr:copper oxidase [Methylocystis heyeri]QGM48207.1 copper oxidase [Methylocystis heyeri]
MFRSICVAIASFGAALLGERSQGLAATISEPPVIASANGVIDIMMIAQAGTVNSFDVAGFYPTGWFYTVCPRPESGTTCPSGANTISPYGGLRLALQPGDKLKIRFVNKLPAVPPDQIERIVDDALLALNPTNLHTHGLIVLAAANKVAPPATPVYGDFVFTSIFNPANGDPDAGGASAHAMLHSHGDVVKTGVADYDIQIPANHPAGSFWFHPHVHGIALNQLSAGLSGIITIGKAASYACGDEDCAKPILETDIRHLIIKDMQVLAGNAPQFQEDPGFCANQPDKTPIGNGMCAGDPGAYAGGSWFFTLNGQRYPTIPVASGDGELWRFTNASGSASYDLQLVDDATGQPMAVQVVSIDGVSLSFPAGSTAGQIMQVGGNRIKLARCGPPPHPRGASSAASVDAPGALTDGLAQSYSSMPVCATDLFLTSATRVEIHVAYRNADNVLTVAPRGATATLRSAGVQTGPGGDSWPAVNLARVTFSAGAPHRITEAVHVVKGAASSVRAYDGIFKAAATDAARAPLPAGCAALAPGHRRRIYFGNPNVPGGVGPGQDAEGNAIFGLGYEEIDPFGAPVPGTFVDLTRFDPSQLVCLPLGPGQTAR